MIVNDEMLKVCDDAQEVGQDFIVIRTPAPSEDEVGPTIVIVSCGDYDGEHYHGYQLPIVGEIEVGILQRMHEVGCISDFQLEWGINNIVFEHCDPDISSFGETFTEAAMGLARVS